MSDKPLTKCPKCGKKVQRLIGGGIGIIFKGSGFYVTDNKSPGSNGQGKKSAEKSDSGENAGAASNSEGKKSEDKKSDGKKKEEKKTA